uniref:hypothetical protein n=1 Tax=Endozoicomonas sp. YOMI1 TaxID=2828739 RepID=UPI0021498ABF
MINPYFNSPLYSEFQKAYESVMLSSGLVFQARPQRSGLVFGLRVDQTEPGNYLNTLIPCGDSFHNSLSDSRVRVNYSQESQQSEPLDLSHKPGAHQQTDQNTKILASQSELRIDRVWSIAGEGSGEPLSLSLEEVPASGIGKKSRAKYLPSDKNNANQANSNAKYDASDKGKARKVKYALSEKGRANKAKCQAKYEASDKGKASRARYVSS